eukprot:scaffold70230_cov25-Tisochrysis_lutea.AAC.3
MRGLVIDKKRGNLLKLDRHKYVKVSAGPRAPDACSLQVAYHGLDRMTSEERKAIYARSFETAPSFTPPDFSTIDTAFLLVDACLFCQLVSRARPGRPGSPWSNGRHHQLPRAARRPTSATSAHSPRYAH